jgi:hypothetical protein
MSSDQGKRIQASCKIIWGDDADYNIDIETDDWVNYLGYVKKDFGTEFGPLLTMTGFCSSRDQVWRELDRMLDAGARQIQSGQQKTKV